MTRFDDIRVDFDHDEAVDLSGPLLLTAHPNVALPYQSHQALTWKNKTSPRRSGRTFGARGQRIHSDRGDEDRWFRLLFSIRSSPPRIRDDSPHKVGPISEVASINRLNDGSWEMVVSKAYIPILADKLTRLYPGCHFDANHDPFKSTAEDMAYLGIHRAWALNDRWVLERARRMMEDGWPIAANYYARLLKEWLGGLKRLEGGLVSNRISPSVILRCRLAAYRC